MSQYTRVDIVIPIFKTSFDKMEYFSVNYSLKMLSNKYKVVFVYPDKLDLCYYVDHFPGSFFSPFPAIFFESHKNYNQLCYEVGFYSQFSKSSHILILQPDALVVQQDLDKYCLSRYDFQGGPESHEYIYDIRGIPPFSKLDFLAPIRLHGCNGGLSLRRISAFIEVLQEFKELTQFFRSYGRGIGEDIFFSLMGRVSDSFCVANEVAASKFALSYNFSQWIAFNRGVIPFGFHGWYNNEKDKEYVLSLLKDIT